MFLKNGYKCVVLSVCMVTVSSPSGATHLYMQQEPCGELFFMGHWLGDEHEHPPEFQLHPLFALALQSPAFFLSEH